MSKRASYSVSVAGSDISSSIASILTSLDVSLKAGAHGDTATLNLDDTGGQIALPMAGDTIEVSLGWAGEGIRKVFSGTVDEVRSAGSRTGGRMLSISAKGFDTTGKTKQGQRRHWDDKTVSTILSDAGQTAGVTKVTVDPDLASVVIDYWSMVDESFLHMGQRLAAHIGGNFRVQGTEAVMAKRDGEYSPFIEAAVGSTLHTWDISPIVSRGRYGTIRAPWYDKAAALWKNVEVETGLKSDAVLVIRPPCADEADAKRKAKAAAATSKRDAGLGSVAIEGNTGAVPDALCRISGARPGVDGSYKITAVKHTYGRDSGFVTTCDLADPQAGAGEDER